MINESSSQKNEPCLHLTIRSGSNKKITFFAQRGHLATHQGDPILLGLGPQPLQQFRTSNPKESWIIVAQRNFGSPAFAGVNHLNMSPVSAEINRGQQTCRAATDNKAVQRLSARVHHRPSRPLWRGTCGADTGALCPASTCARLALTLFREGRSVLSSLDDRPVLVFVWVLVLHFAFDGACLASSRASLPRNIAKTAASSGLRWSSSLRSSLSTADLISKTRLPSRYDVSTSGCT